MTTYLYRHFDKEGNLLYVGISLSFTKRLKQHSDNSHWFDLITNVTIENFQNRSDALEAERVSIQKENPLFNLRRPTPKEQKDFYKSRAEESGANLVKRIVQFNAIYGVNELARVLNLTINAVKKLIQENKIGHIARKKNPRRNNKGIMTYPTEYLISGWQLIDYIEQLESESVL